MFFGYGPKPRPSVSVVATAPRAVLPFINTGAIWSGAIWNEPSGNISGSCSVSTKVAAISSKLSEDFERPPASDWRSSRLAHPSGGGPAQQGRRKDQSGPDFAGIASDRACRRPR